MSFIARLQRAREILEQQGRLSTRALELEIGGDELEELIEELVNVQQVARREGRIIVWNVPTTNNSTTSATTNRLSPTADAAVARKVVTIVFADLVGSTTLHERLDAESARRVMDRYYGVLHDVVEAHGGTIVKLLGDGVMAAFGVPRVAEDDAIRAVRAAVAMVHAVKGLGEEFSTLTPNPVTPNPLSVRVAVNTGEVVVSAANDDVVGDPVNVAARLQQEAQPGDVVIGEATRRLVGTLVTLAPLGAVSLRGRSETVAAYRVVSLERPAGASAVVFVGRAGELRRLAAVYDAAVAAPAARLAVILGSPGLGKSRLLDELAHRLDRATVLTAHCESAGGATFAPIARALRAHLHIEDGTDVEDLRAVIATAVPGDESDRPRIANGIGALLAGTPASPEETFFVIRRFLTALAATPPPSPKASAGMPPSPEASQGMRPVVLTIDDLQWAEPLLLDLVEHLVQWGKGVPLLLLVAARPDLRDVRSSLTQPGDLVSDVVTLAGLDAGAATRLAANVIGADELPAAVAGRVLATSEGNPLFVGELVRMLVDDGALTREGDRWTAAVDLAALEMPPTIHALLAARIERLGADDRLVLERAAIVGRQFSRAAVAELLPAESRAHLDARLEALRRSELIDSDASWFLGEPALRFHHGLTRDAAYRRVLKGTRAELHGRCAQWIESRVGEAIEHDETIGWHLEQAHQHLRELGTVDAHGHAFGERASRYLAAAGRRALERDDLAVAADLLGRAINVLDIEDTARADLALDWCEALLTAGDVGSAAKAIEELARFTGADAGFRLQGSGFSREVPHDAASIASQSETEPRTLKPEPREAARLRAWHTCFTGQLAVLTDPQALHTTAEAVAAAAEKLAAAGDGAGEAKAHLIHALALSRLGKVGACEAELDKALAAARRVNDRRRSNTVLANAPLAALWGPSPVTRASGRCLDVVRVLRITQGAPAVEAVALRCQALLEALRGRTEAARRMIASARRMVEELGITQQLLEADVFGGLVDLLEGDAGSAERSLRAAYDGLRERGLGIDAARAAAFLGRALLTQGRAAEAEAVSHDSETLAGDDLQAAITWRGVRAEALATRGEHAAAVEFARAAVDLAVVTDALLLHADARQALAAVLRIAGRPDEAAAEEARAIELWEAKGATLLAERSRGTPGAEQVEPPREERLEPAHPLRRRVQPNAATAAAARVNAAFAARDADALARLSVDFVDHAAHLAFDRRDLLKEWRMMLRADDLSYHLEPLATLGASLALCRRSMSASGVSGGKFDVGAYESEHVILIEVDAQEGRGRSESFAADRLGDAVARLYERYAELLPEGAERERAAARARSLAALGGSMAVDLDSWAAAIAPDIDYVDHRTIGIGPTRGAEAFLRGVRSLLEVADDIAYVVHDILALRPEALLGRQTNFGTDRTGGGVFERPFLLLWIFGADGLLSRLEQFDVGDEAEALARFDQLVLTPVKSHLTLRRAQGDRKEPSEVHVSAARPEPVEERVSRKPTPPHPLHRRVHANAAIGNAARIDAAIAARDADAIADLFADDAKGMEHPGGVATDRPGMIFSWRILLSAQEPGCRHEPLATLGDSLSLCRLSTSASGFAGGRFDVGAYDREGILLNEVDLEGRCRWSELFAADHLGDAVARLYERYADLLPEGMSADTSAGGLRSAGGVPKAGPAHTSAAAIARSVAILLGPIDYDFWATAIAPAVEVVDRRILGTFSGSGAEALLRNLRAWHEVGADLAISVNDVLALQSGALLTRRTFFGTDRASGGAFERRLIQLLVFGCDGLLTRLEQFDADRDAEALARFEEVAGPSPSALSSSPAPLPLKERANAASPTRNLGWWVGSHAAGDPLGALAKSNAAIAAADRVEAAFAARDWAAMRAACTADTKVEDRRRHISIPGGVDGWIKERQRAARAGVAYQRRLVATGGEHLALERVTCTGPSGQPFAGEYLWLTQVDESGRITSVVAFDVDDRLAASRDAMRRMIAGDPVAAESIGPILEQIEGFNDHDLARIRAVLADDVVMEDHRLTGAGRGAGVKSYMEGVRVLWALAPDGRFEAAHVLACERGGFVGVGRTFGTLADGGGEFETFGIHVFILEHGRIIRHEQFEPEDADAALARFAELKPDPLRIPPNAVTRANERARGLFRARDWQGSRALASADFIYEDRRKHAQVTGDVEMWIRSLEEAISWPGFRATGTLIGTAGDRVMVVREVWHGDPDTGAFEVELIRLIEIAADGRFVAWINFDVDDRSAAFAEAHARFAAGEAAVIGGQAPVVALVCAFRRHDWDAFRKCLAPGVMLRDHRTLGFGTLDQDEWIESLRVWAELAPDLDTEVLRILAWNRRGCTDLARLFGTRDGGAFESVLIHVFITDGAHIQRCELFDVGDADKALARFDELVPSPVERPITRVASSRIENAATRLADRLADAWAARDWEGIAATFAPGFRLIDRRSYAHLDLDLDQHLESLRFRFEMRSSHTALEVIATRGRRLALIRQRFALAGGDVGPSETESLNVAESDEHGNFVVLVTTFDPDDLDAAYAELDARYAAGEAAPFAAVATRAFAFSAVVKARDWDALAAVLAPDLLVYDHRPLGWGTLRGAALVDTWKSLVELAPDVRLRIDHFTASASGSLAVLTLLGTHEGGDFEDLRIVVHEYDESGKICRHDIYNVEQLDEARARFEELRPKGCPSVPSDRNTAGGAP